MLASEVMNTAASLLNDTSRYLFTYTVQLPYLKLALDELRESLQLDNAELTNKTDESITVTAGVTEISFSTTPALPSDLIEIQGLYERQSGVTEDWQPMTRGEFLPTYVTQVESLIYFTMQEQSIKFIGATTDRQLRLDYIANGIPLILTENSTISVINAKTFLQYRTAALIAQFVGENKERSDDLNIMARLSMDRLLGINAKGRQAITTRRRPFMANYKSRGML